ncbi:hypothetical protein J2S04_002559 [Alicyclobacillus tengchongensis]|uniref:DUF1772 domain-containing protein n=1 Tax=Alicyclobacillus tolerans TaxID=90970 RepID=A0ABT9LZ74_9BACL|nr:hypothetical protein [Alicyclobacillus tengchongensis]
MINNGSVLLLLTTLVLAFYNVGTIWAHEIDIFRTWKLLDPNTFRRVQTIHWNKLTYWVFIPVGLSFLTSIMLIWYHPLGTPSWAIWGNLILQLLSHALTALMWGPWQAKLSRDELGPRSPYLRKILKTHWIRTTLINTHAFVLFIWLIKIIK